MALRPLCNPSTEPRVAKPRCDGPHRRRPAQNVTAVMKVLDRAQSRIPQPWRTIVDWFVTVAAAVAFVLTLSSTGRQAVPHPLAFDGADAPLRETDSFLPRAIQRSGNRQPACVQVR
jgi:hypothetical protein